MSAASAWASDARMGQLADKLLDWFASHQRPLPWREGYDPYAVWISEMMLQQTQMDRVVDYFERWMARFPDVASVAAAAEDDILKAWEGLGYYRRARAIHQAAKTMVAEHGGTVPDDDAAVRALPGVGPYTAGAIVSIAFNRPAPLVDANVERVFARIFDLDAPVKEPETRRFIWDTAETLIPPGRAREFNQALMELGALVCGKNPRCSACPITEHCEAHRLGIVHERPVPAKAAKIIPLEVASGVLVHKGRVFIQKRPDSGVWAGLWEFPGGRLEPGETPETAVVREFAEETGYATRIQEKLAVIKHGYTNYRVTLYCFLLGMEGAAGEEKRPEPPAAPQLTAATDFQWATLKGMERLAFPAGHRKLIDRLNRDLRFVGI